MSEVVLSSDSEPPPPPTKKPRRKRVNEETRALHREEWEKKLSDLFYDARGGYTSKKDLQTAAKDAHPDIPAPFVSEFYDAQKLTQDLKTPRKRPFLPQAPGQQYHADLIFYKGSRSKKFAGFNLALVVVDAFTKKLSVYPLPNKTADCVADAMKRAFHDLGGPPSFLVTDNGKEFQGAVQNKVLEPRGVIHVVRLRHPRFIDRAQKTFRHMLYKRIASLREPNMNLYKQVLEQYNQRRHSATGFAPNELAIPEGGLESSSDAKKRRETNNLAFAFMRYAAGKLKLTKPPKLPDQPKPKRALLRPFLEREIARRQKEREERRTTVHERVYPEVGEKKVEPLSAIVGELQDTFLKEDDTVRRAMKLGTYHHKSENPQWFEEKVKVSEVQGGKNREEVTDGSPLFVLQDFKDLKDPDPAKRHKHKEHKLLHIHSDLLKITETQAKPKTKQIIDANEYVNPRWQAYRDQTDELARKVLELVPLTDDGISRKGIDELKITLSLPKDLPSNVQEKTAKKLLAFEEAKLPVKAETKAEPKGKAKKGMGLTLKQLELKRLQREVPEKVKSGGEFSANFSEWLEIFSVLPVDMDPDPSEAKNPEEEEETEGKQSGKSKKVTPGDFAQRHADFFEIFKEKGKAAAWRLTTTGKLFRTRDFAAQILAKIRYSGMPAGEVLQKATNFEEPAKMAKAATWKVSDVLKRLYDIKGEATEVDLNRFCQLYERALVIEAANLKPTLAYVAWDTKEIAEKTGKCLLVLGETHDLEPANILSNDVVKDLKALSKKLERGLDVIKWFFELHSSSHGEERLVPSKFELVGDAWVLRRPYRARLTQDLAHVVEAILGSKTAPMELGLVTATRIPLSNKATLLDELRANARKERKADAEEGFKAFLRAHAIFKAANEEETLWTLTPEAQEVFNRRKELRKATLWPAKVIYDVLIGKELQETTLQSQVLGRLESIKHPKASKICDGREDPVKCLGWKGKKGKKNDQTDVEQQLNWKLTEHLTVSQHLELESYAEPRELTDFFLPDWGPKGPVSVLNAILHLHSNLFFRDKNLWRAFNGAGLSDDPSDVPSLGP